MMEFRINEFLSLALVAGETVVLVAGKRFKMCKHLLFEVSAGEAAALEEIESIDELTMLRYGKLEIEPIKVFIPPETAFWGHCSNLQAWYGHGYDTRLLHANLAFPLLKALAKAGDPAAKNAYHEEIVSRLERASMPVVEYILEFFVDVGELVDDEEAMERLLENVNFRMAIAHNENTPPSIIDRLARDNEFKVRKMILFNYKIKPDILELLSKDEIDAVRLQVACYPYLSSKLCETLAEDKNVFIKTEIASHGKFEIETWEKLASDEDERVRFAIAENTNTPINILKKIAKDKDPRVRRTVMLNINTPSEIKQVLKDDLEVISCKSIFWYYRNYPESKLWKEELLENQ
ncbi:MAG: hypothetical protein ACTSUE_25405 [Promethearchaeota archaeon]